MRHSVATPPGPLGRLLALAGGLMLLVLGFLFSLVLLAVFLVAGLAAWGYFWWRSRKLRQAMGQHRAGGTVIDGEAVVVEEPAPTLAHEPGESGDR